MNLLRNRRLIVFITLVLLIPMGFCSIATAQTNSIHLRNGSNTSTLLPSPTGNVSLQIPSLSDGTYFVATSNIDPGPSGFSTFSYGATSPQNSLNINSNQYLFDVSYSNSAVNSQANGARIVSTATSNPIWNSRATGLSIFATASGSGTATGVLLRASSPSGTADAAHILRGRLAFLDATGLRTTTFAAGNQSANINYILPTSPGTDGQVLTTDGSGNLSWASLTLGSFTNTKTQGSNFNGSMFIRPSGSATGTLSNAQYNTGLGSSVFRSITSASRSTGIGSGALQADASGSDNISVGSQFMVPTPTRERSTAFGETAHNDADGIEHLSFGYEAGFSNTPTSQGNSVIGFRPLRNETSGDYIVAVGYDVMYTGGSGSLNIAFGWNAMNGGGAAPISGGYNIAIGGDNAISLESGNSNILLGYDSGYAITTGSGNLVFGYVAGADLSTGSQNVILGYNVCLNNTLDTESNLFVIDRSNTTAPLIQGDFTNSSEYLKINGDLQVTGGTTLATGADQAVAGNAVTVDATAYSAVKVTSDNDATADAITITGGSDGMVMYIDFVNTGNNDVTIGGVTHAIADTKSAGITVCRINGTWRVVGIAEY